MRNSKDEINAILENFIIYACGSNDKERDILEATLEDYQEVMSDEGCGLEDCPFLNDYNREVGIEFDEDHVSSVIFGVDNNQ
jgi:hypothetical protein